MAKLCIAIPTFNRAEQLEKALQALLEQILATINVNNISVLISDNGSTDNTEKVIDNYKKKFHCNHISLKKVGFDSNQGFDKNLYNCYEHSSGDYVWFLSDDDIIDKEAINKIIKDIKFYKPNVIYYNFDQIPYTKDNKYIQESFLYDTVNEKNLESISKIIKWAKLSAIVLKKVEIKDDFVRQNFQFMHASLAIYIGLKIGNILHSKYFIAKVEEDYLDHIDFVPFVGNYMVDNINSLLSHTGHHKLFHQLNKKFPLTKVDPVISSLNHLINVYKAGLKINKDLELKLNNIIRLSIKDRGWRILTEPIYLKYGYAYMHKYYPLFWISSLRTSIRNRYKTKKNMIKSIRKKISNIISQPKKYMIKSYSQYSEDILIRAVFDVMGIHNPTYLDIGANHPYLLSNTYLFYSTGSKGVLVEPNIELHKHLKAKRKRDVCLNVGIGLDEQIEADFYLMDADVLSTFSKKEAHFVEAQGTYRIEKVVRVPLMNINLVIDKYFTTKPHFISIDVEGMDYEILQTFDFSRNRPIVFCVETLMYQEDRHAPKIKEIINLMLENDYFIYADTHLNTIFVDKREWY